MAAKSKYTADFIKFVEAFNGSMARAKLGCLLIAKEEEQDPLLKVFKGK